MLAAEVGVSTLALAELRLAVLAEVVLVLKPDMLQRQIQAAAAVALVVKPLPEEMVVRES
jgi:hypothetical protein|tara:strand:- start:289 stop:468 length:180 start_codon:yes stop_codon:yes gene_type:complete